MYARDKAGNSSIVQATVYQDSIPPVPGNNGIINVKAETKYSAVFSWDEGSDNYTGSTDLFYSVYISQERNIETVSEIEANGQLIGSGKGISSVYYANLSSDTDYYVNIVIEDSVGNKEVYQMAVFNSGTADFPFNGEISVMQQLKTDSPEIGSAEITWEACEEPGVDHYVLTRTPAFSQGMDNVNADGDIIIN
ncbi:MAG TPA: hypothetical protein DC049_00585, partial [Spirochaetia bacterium]|nr:hypothetical protein [Spirochaetia bacterium]